MGRCVLSAVVGLSHILFLSLCGCLVEGQRVFDVTPSTTSGEISGNITAVSLLEALTVRVHHGVYNIQQTSAILTTRGSQITVQAIDGTVSLDCSRASIEEKRSLLPLVVPVPDQFALIGDSITTLVGCPLVFLNASGSLTLDGVHVFNASVVSVEDPALPGGPITDTVAAVAVVRQPDAVIPPTPPPVSVTRCLFYQNSLTPLLISAPGSCVNVSGSNFSSNRVVVDSDYSSLLNATGTSMASGGLALKVIPHVNGCPGGEDVTVNLCNFESNSLAIPEPDTIWSEQNDWVLSNLNGGLGACGGALYFQLPNALVNVANVLGTNLTFEGNMADDESHRGGARQDSHGGSACVQYLTGNDSHRVTFEAVQFRKSRAYRAGAMLVSFEDNCRNSKLMLLGESGFEANLAQQSENRTQDSEARGGAIGIHFGPSTENNSMIIRETRFSENVATEGGAVYVAYYPGEAINHAHFRNCTFADNQAVAGAAVYVWSGHTVGTTIAPLRGGNGAEIVQYKKATLFESCQFVQNTAYMSGGVYAAYTHLMFRGEVLFANNTNSALSLTNSFAYIEYGTHVTFFRNIGGIGGAVYLSTGQVIVYNHTTLDFVENMAQSTGGGIHADMHTR